MAEWRRRRSGFGVSLYIYSMKNLFPCSLFLILTLLLSCSGEPEQFIMTVQGPIPASALGPALTHEHVLVDFIGADSIGFHRWNRQEVIKRVMPYLSELNEHQVSALMECTPAYLGRDPLILKALSEQSGMHLITNTGYYGALNNRFLPSEFYKITAEELSQIWVNEFENGIEGSGIRPGFIKIGVDGNDRLSVEHLKIIRAAALAHQKTGLVIASHTGPDAPAFEQISVIQSHGLDPSCFIWVHAQGGSQEGNIRAAQMGSWVSLDNVNLNREVGSKYDVNWYAERILKLKEAGYLDRVLISHDAGWYKPGEKNGGTFRGYTGIFTSLIPALKQRGFSDQDIEQLIEVNPRNAFSLKI